MPAFGRALGHLWRTKPGQFSRVPKVPNLLAIDETAADSLP